MLTEDAGGKRKKAKKSPLMNLFKKSPKASSRPSQGKLFGCRLEDICEDGELPKSIQVPTI